jgi:hypothetical protein
VATRARGDGGWSLKETAAALPTHTPATPNAVAQPSWNGRGLPGTNTSIVFMKAGTGDMVNSQSEAIFFTGRESVRAT